MDSQLKKGVLDVCVLTAVYSKDSYGYQIIKDLKDVIEISESTLYPILRRLEKMDILRSTLRNIITGCVKCTASPMKESKELKNISKTYRN